MTFNRFAGLGTLHALRTLVFFARAPLGCDVSRAGNGRSAMRVLRFASAARAGSACGCSGAVPERRVTRRPTRQWRGKSLYKTQPACIQVRETVEGHNHTKSLI